MKKITTISLLMFSSLTVFSQETDFQPYTVVAKKSTNGKAFEVSKKSITVTKYEYDWVDNPEYVSRIKKIDSLQNRIEELNKSNKKNNLIGSLKKEIGLSSKKNKKHIEIEELISQKRTLEKDIPPRNGLTTGYTYKIPKKINAYVPAGNMQREILVIDPTKNVSTQLGGNVFAEEITTPNGRTYRLVNQDTLHFKKDELVTRDVIGKYFHNDYEKLSTEIGFLIKRESDDSIFCVDSNFGKNLMGQKEYEFAKILDDLGIEVELTNPNLPQYNPILHKNNKKCILTEEIKEYLINNKNADIIDKVNNSVAQYKNFLKQQEEICLRMVKHTQAYKSRTMTDSRRIEWEKDTKTAISLQEKMRKLSYFESITAQLEIEENRLGSAVSDLIQASRITLGI